MHFHWVHDEDGGRIQEKRVCAKDGKEVPYEHIARSFEISKGQSVIFQPGELEKLAAPKDGACEIERFVDLAEIDPVYFGATYYSVPDKGAAKSYRLLVEAMKRSARVGIGRIVLRTRESPVAIRPVASGLALSILHTGDEVRDPAELEEGSATSGRAFSPAELKMAQQLIAQLDGPFKPNEFRDTYRERVKDLARRKSKGSPAPEAAAEPTTDPTTDWMDALKRSLASRASGTRAVGRRPPRRSKPATVRRARQRG